MSLGEADAKYPTNHASGIPPSPSRENPGQVFPKSDPSDVKLSTLPPQTIEQSIGNPFLMRNALQKVDHTFSEVIAILEDEENAQGGSRQENALLETFRAWKDDLERMRAIHGVGESAGTSSLEERTDPAQEGGMFTD